MTGLKNMQLGALALGFGAMAVGVFDEAEGS